MKLDEAGNRIWSLDRITGCTNGIEDATDDEPGKTLPGKIVNEGFNEEQTYPTHR